MVSNIYLLFLFLFTMSDGILGIRAAGVPFRG